MHLTCVVSPARGLYLHRQLVGERLSQVLATQASLGLISSAFRMLQTGLLAVSIFNKIFMAIFRSQEIKYRYLVGSV